MLKASSNGILLFVKVIPNANKNEVIGRENDRLKIRLRAIPEKGKANTELIQFLSKVLEIPKSSLSLTQGETSRLKTVLIQGIDKEVILEKIDRCE